VKTKCNTAKALRTRKKCKKHETVRGRNNDPNFLHTRFFSLKEKPEIRVMNIGKISTGAQAKAKEGITNFRATNIYAYISLYMPEYSFVFLR
jgi:sRNA-binding protein